MDRRSSNLFRINLVQRLADGRRVENWMLKNLEYFGGFKIQD